MHSHKGASHLPSTYASACKDCEGNLSSVRRIRTLPPQLFMYSCLYSLSTLLRSLKQLFSKCSRDRNDPFHGLVNVPRTEITPSSSIPPMVSEPPVDPRGFAAGKKPKTIKCISLPTFDAGLFIWSQSLFSL